ncbi:hypothetical protein HAX54_051765 [Datura stramonium]|uniref:Uncharacterized protein n=1 Tax=Datura stramonium TaxID=4076 RepID=A0ABS8SZ13_DATST|nr:hypothetical protein [Datura stramonium]
MTFGTLQELTRSILKNGVLGEITSSPLEYAARRVRKPLREDPFYGNRNLGSDKLDKFAAIGVGFWAGKRDPHMSPRIHENDPVSV